MAFPVNLTSGLTYVATVKFCSNGGCGRYAVVTMSCDVCESLGLPGSRFHSTCTIEGRAGIRALLTIEFYCRYALIPARPSIGINSIQWKLPYM